MSRNVRGSLFVDYIRMIRRHKSVQWQEHLDPEDLDYLDQRVEMDRWYPMETFTRLGSAILEVIAGGNPEAARMWGSMSVDKLCGLYPSLMVEGDPMESLMRIRVLRQTFFDFEAVEVEVLSAEHARLEMCYHMSNGAEEAACLQTLGFFERILQLAGADEVHANFVERSWKGDPRTVLNLSWNQPSQGRPGAHRDAADT